MYKQGLVYCPRGNGGVVIGLRILADAKFSFYKRLEDRGEDKGVLSLVERVAYDIIIIDAPLGDIDNVVTAIASSVRNPRGPYVDRIRPVVSITEEVPGLVGVLNGMHAREGIIFTKCKRCGSDFDAGL